MSARSALLAALVIALILACADSAFSQITVAQLNGSVRDESGAAVKSATLTLRETSTNASYATTSNDSGFYVIPNLPPGQYELTVTFTGFATLIDKGIVLTVGQTATVEFTLKAATKSGQSPVTPKSPRSNPPRRKSAR